MTSSSRTRIGQGKKTIVFLGAGASAAEGAPLQNALFNDYFKSIRSSVPYERSHDMQRQLATFFYIMFGIDVDPPYNLDEVTFPTFEEALGVLDLAQLRQESFKDFGLETSASNSGRIRFIRLYLVLAMAKAIAGKLSNARDFHRTLVNNLAEKQLLTSTTFVSTNYDILIDNALTARDDYPPGKTVDYGVDFFKSHLGDWAKPSSYATRLFKVHGSLHWLFCPACNYLVITPFEKGVIRLIDNPTDALCQNCRSLMAPIIIPPICYKDMSNIFISTVWHRAEAALREADHITFCGYSFPDADMHIKYLIKRAQINRREKHYLKFTVINYHPDKKPEQVQEEENRYKRFLRGPIKYTHSSFEDFANAPEQFYQS